jgi:hypothetical protein
MELHRWSELAAAVAWPAEWVVCALALVRRLWRYLPYFAIYLVLIVLTNAGRWAVLLAAGSGSPTYSWFYWMTQPVHILARAAALADVCRAALSPYSGLWRFARPVLMLAATLMLGLAALDTGGSHWMVSYLVFLERELEFAVVISLLILLALSRYYGLIVERPLDGIALGLAFYSSFLIIRDTIILEVLNVPWPVVSLASTIAYAVTLGIWGFALWGALPERARPVLSTVESYELNTRVVSDRMRELNERMLKLMKS